MGYIGRDNSVSTFTKQSITADGGTSFTLNQGVGDSSSILVSIGGIVQQPDVAYTASGTALTFTSAPTNAYPIWVVYLGKELTVSSELLYDNCDTQVGVGNGTATPITLDNSVSSVNDIIVTLNGIAQKPGTDFTVSGTTLTFTTAPSAAMNILVYYLALGGGANIPSNMSVTSASQFAASGTWPAWNGAALTGIGGATQADIDALIASLATLSFLRNIDHTTALLNMVNGWSTGTFATDGYAIDGQVHSDHESKVNLTFFDGTGDGLTISDGTLGQSDGKSFIISFYMKAEMDDGVQKTMFTTDNNRLQVYRSTDNKLGLVLENPSATEIAHIKSTNTITKSDGLVHCLIAIDMANTTVQMSLNGAAVETNVVLTAVANDNIDFTNNFSIAKRASVYYHGLLGQIYLTQEYLDISNSANREKFYKDGPVFLGANGEKPTGNQPRIYLNNMYNSFQNNSGSGGNFTVTSHLPTGLANGGEIATGKGEYRYHAGNDNYYNSTGIISAHYGRNTVKNMYAGSQEQLGWAETFATGQTITSLGIQLTKTGGPTGEIYLRIYNATGTVGTNALPTGNYIASGEWGINPVPMPETNAISGAKEVFYNFQEPVHLPAGDYCFVLEYTGGDGSNYLKPVCEQNITGQNLFSTNTAGSNWSMIGTTVAVTHKIYGNRNLDIITKGTDDLSTTDSPASAPTKGHIEALVDNRIIDVNIKDRSSLDHTITKVTGFDSASPQLSTTQTKINPNSIYFDGSGDYLTVPASNLGISGTGSFTVEGWIWHSSASVGNTDYDRVFNMAHSGDTDGEFVNMDMSPSGGYGMRVMAETQSGNRDIWNGSATSASHGLTDETWHHFAYVRDGNNFNLYVDGVSKISTTSSGTIGAGDTFAFGGYAYPFDHNSCFQGYMDELRISNVARYTSNFTPSTTAFTSDANTKLLIGGNAYTYPTLNTHIIGELSRDGGTTWSPATLARSSTGINGATTEILSGDVDFTGDPSGTNVVGRIKTVHKHNVTVDGISVNWS